MIGSIMLDVCRLAREDILPPGHFMPYETADPLSFCASIPNLNNNTSPYAQYINKMMKVDDFLVDKSGFYNTLELLSPYYLPNDSNIKGGTWKVQNMSLFSQIRSNKVVYEEYSKRDFSKKNGPDFTSLKINGGTDLERDKDLLEEQVRRNMNGYIPKTFIDLY